MPPSPNYHGNVYSSLKDVLQRVPQIDSDRVYYRPSSADKRYLEAYVRPDRLDSLIGAEDPTITVKWTQHPSPDEFRIDYADPNIQFHCGWHQDDDHPEYGEMHFQYDHPGLDKLVYQAATVEAITPPRILWDILDRLFVNIIPSVAAPLYR
ncbi:hypothetical protein [Halalkalicoccus subterraneus]|uniref:hypothetical protein n=1 Tax=Halalkalicoccus subterraneus TaxID=2675002 RepID=UPI0013CE5257|nr:hypothetical protein [Halalkalicoccus subterraneus]